MREGDHVLLEDIDVKLSDWAKDFLQMYWEKADLEHPDLSDSEKAELAKKMAVGAEVRQHW